MKQYDNNDGRSGRYGVPSPSLAEWLNTVTNSVMKMLGLGAADSEQGSATQPPRSSAGLGHSGVKMPQSPKRTLAGYINTGIYKFEQARRSSAIAKQYRGTLHTIRLTRRAVRRTPRANRYLFQGYSSVLRDAKQRVKQLYSQIQIAEGHLRRYDPHAISDEIRRLEAAMQAASSAAARAEAEMRLEARRDLLATVQEFDDRIESLAEQLGAISAALELNHVKIITIGGSVLYTPQDDSLNIRMQEVTEQLKFLEESLRELR